MPEYLAPGVYVEEVERGAKPLEGVSTSTAGFLGPTERGPTDPRLLTSFADFERAYGGHIDESYLATAVEGFFTNGGNRCYVGRIAAEDEETAEGVVYMEGEAGDDLEPLLGVDRATIDLGEVAEPDEASETITLTHEGDEDVDDVDIVLDDHAEIQTTMGSNGGFSVEWVDATFGTGDTVTLEPGGEQDVRVTFGPLGGEWRHRAQLTIDPGGEVEPVAVDLQGLNEDESGDDLLETGEVLDFGVVEDEAEVDATLTVENTSGVSIDIDPAESDIIGPDEDDYSLEEDTTITLGSGDQEDLAVRFTPSTNHVGREATLLLAHDGDNSPLVVELRGGLERVVMTATAVGPGEWGGHVAILVEDASMYEPEQNDLFKLKVRYWTDEEDVAAAMAGDADPENEGVPDPDVEEVFDDLSPAATASNYYLQEVDGTSVLIELADEQTGRPATDAGPSWLDVAEVDAEIDAEDYAGDPSLPPEDRTGFAGFEKIDGISIVCVPDEHGHGVTGDLVEHCHGMEDRFAILQAPENPAQTADLRPPEDTDMAAFYYPWLEVVDPETGMIEDVPPGGHVAGIYARSDAQRGVHKAPANEVVRGIEGLQRTITKGEQEVLNPRGVNCIRGFRGRGIRVWGARTASSDPEWKYVNVRRLFLFLRESIEEGTQWVVFEPNDEQLLARVRQTISNFLTDVWDDGALMGTSPEEAFFVKCDRSTMTQSDIENGRLICEIGVAPVRPAEFVVFRIAQWTGSAE